MEHLTCFPVARAFGPPTAGRAELSHAPIGNHAGYMTNLDHRGAVVVGVDDSIHSDLAVRAAVEIARRENRPLHILHGYHLSPTIYPAFGPGMNIHECMEAIREGADDVVKKAMRLARELAPWLDITGTVCPVDAREALEQAAETAFIVVTGSRGRGPMRSMLLGSVSLWLTQHSRCPVLVVRPPASPEAARVVVGVDGSEASLGAVEFAFSQASMQGVPLTVVHCFTTTFRGGYGLTGQADEDLDNLQGEWLAIAESVAGLREKYPDVDAAFELKQGYAPALLVDSSRQASLVVVGSRHLSAARVVFGGSVSRPVVEHAHCSVAVIPA